MVEKTNIYSEIFSSRFGVKIGKIDESHFHIDSSLDESLDSFKEQKFDLVVARIDLTRLDLINQLEQRGFTLKDTQCILRNTLRDVQGNYVLGKVEREDGYLIREFDESDTDEILEITRESFVNYGHWAEDERLDQKDSLDVYVDYAYNACTDRDVATKIYVAEKNNEVAAYISYKKAFDADKAYAFGVIGAVKSNHRRKGLYHDMSVTALEWSSKNKLDWKEHSVLVGNFPVMKSFMSVGFRPQKFVATLHGWLDEKN